MKIPIQNLYFLLVYAWDVLDEAGVVDVAAERIRVPTDLFGRILRNGIDHLLKRGLDRLYATETAEIAGIRGRLELSASIKANSFTRGRVYCTYDELTYDVVHNQILKSTLMRLVRDHDIDLSLKQDLRDLAQRLEGVSEIPLTQHAFRQVQLHSNNRFYRLLIQVCALLHRQLLPDPSGKGYQFADFTEEQLETIFESFVRNFYKREQDKYQVKVERFRWQRTTGETEALDRLPTMKTDASLVCDDHKLVVETKFYRKALRRHQYGDREAVRSTHLFQLFTYLENLQARDSIPAHGLLIYPEVDEDFSWSLEMFGHAVRVATVNLLDSPEAIGARLLECARP